MAGCKILHFGYSPTFGETYCFHPAGKVYFFEASWSVRNTLRYNPEFITLHKVYRAASRKLYFMNSLRDIRSFINSIQFDFTEPLRSCAVRHWSLCICCLNSQSTDFVETKHTNCRGSSCDNIVNA